MKFKIKRNNTLESLIRTVIVIIFAELILSIVIIKDLITLL